MVLALKFTNYIKDKSNGWFLSKERVPLYYLNMDLLYKFVIKGKEIRYSLYSYKTDFRGTNHPYQEITLIIDSSSIDDIDLIFLKIDKSIIDKQKIIDDIRNFFSVDHDKELFKELYVSSNHIPRVILFPNIMKYIIHKQNGFHLPYKSFPSIYCVYVPLKTNMWILKISKINTNVLYTDGNIKFIYKMTDQEIRELTISNILEI